MGSLTHLTIGKERIPSKPPRSNPPCTEPYVTGTNILKDPGFELHIANTGGGPLGDEIPAIALGAQTVWTDNTTNPNTNYGWAADSNISGSTRWQVVTTDPDAGTYHARTTNIGGASNNGGELYVFGLYSCSLIMGSSLWNGFSARVEPGDYVRFKVRAKCSATTGAPLILLTLYWFEGVAGPDSSTVDSGSVALTTSYADYVFAAFVPTAPNPGDNATQFLRATIVGWGGQAGTVYDVDSCELEMSP